MSAPADTLRHAMQTLELSRTAGHRMLEIMSLNDIGYSHALRNHYQQVCWACRRWSRTAVPGSA